MAADIYVAVQSFSIRWDGHPLVVARGTTVREGHPLYVAYKGLFRPIKPDFEYVAPPSPSASKPPVVKSAARPAGVVAEGE